MTTVQLTDEQLVLAQVQPTPEQTAAAWTVLPGRVLDLNWAEIALLAIQHRVEGIVEEALRLSGCADQVSASVLSTLRRRADLADARYVACYDALVALHRQAPDVVANLVFFKGATLIGLYNAPHHRMLGDFDFIVPEDSYGELRAAFDRLGFWEKPGRNGPTFFGQAANPQIGCEYVVFDVHLQAPAKYNRTEASLDGLWLSSTEPYVLGEIECRRLDKELEMLELLAHMSEHAGSWIHACLDDDVRLIRLLDVELLCASGGVSGARVGELARRFGLHGEVALGLGLVAAVRGDLPAPLAELREHADAAADLVDAVALPDGRIETWITPARQRVFLTNRAACALRMMPADRRHRDDWFDWREGLIEGQEDVAAIARQVRDRLHTSANAGQP